MDGTREGDLKKLHRDFNNPLLPLSSRRKAHRAFHNILRQVNDRTLMRQRLQLLRAHKAGDAEAAERITMQLHDYTERAGYATAG